MLTATFGLGEGCVIAVHHLSGLDAAFSLFQCNTVSGRVAGVTMERKTKKTKKPSVAAALRLENRKLRADLAAATSRETSLQAEVKALNVRLDEARRWTWAAILRLSCFSTAKTT